MQPMKTHENQTVNAAEEEAARLMQLLNRLVRLSRKSMRSLEMELDLGSSVVSKILAGVIRPQLSYVLMIAAAVGVPPEQFFALAYGFKKQVTHPLLRGLMEVGGAPDAEEGEIQVTPEELSRMVDAAVRRSLQRLATDPGSPSEPTRP